MKTPTLHNNAQARADGPPPPETIVATSTRVGCDGGAGMSQGALGHPLVYLTLTPDAAGIFTAECGYCDRKFVLAADADPHGHH